MPASPALVEVIARAVADDMYAAERSHPDGDIAVAARVFPVLYVAAREGVGEVSGHLVSRESIVDFAAAHRYTVAATTTVTLVLFVATTHRLFIVDHRDAGHSVEGFPWSSIRVDRAQLSVLPRITQEGAVCVVGARGPVADWLEALQRQRPAGPVGRLGSVLGGDAPG